MGYNMALCNLHLQLHHDARKILPHPTIFPSNDSNKYIPEGQPGYDPLFKLQPFADPLITNFQAAFTLGYEVSVDESMIGFKGRLWFIQYMPKKHTKWGMKAYVLAESITEYTYNWRPYTGTNIQCNMHLGT